MTGDNKETRKITHKYKKDSFLSGYFSRLKATVIVRGSATEKSKIPKVFLLAGSEKSFLLNIHTQILIDGFCLIYKASFSPNSKASTVESRFFEPPRETKIGWKNRKVREIGR